MATITLKGNTINTAGSLPRIGSQAPDFTLTKADLTDLTLQECLTKGNKVLLNIFPSLDTPTCAMSVRQFNELASQVNNTFILCVSADLPFAQKRFCGAEKLERVVPLSTFRHSDFGNRYGVTITDGPLAGLLSRAIVILDEKGRVVYTQQVAEIADEPNYDAALAELKKEVTV